VFFAAKPLLDANEAVLRTNNDIMARESREPFEVGIMDFRTPLTATVLSIGIGFQQIAGHGEDHNHPENLIPHPFAVRPFVLVTATTPFVNAPYICREGLLSTSNTPESGKVRFGF